MNAASVQEPSRDPAEPATSRARADRPTRPMPAPYDTQRCAPTAATILIPRRAPAAGPARCARLPAAATSRRHAAALAQHQRARPPPSRGCPSPAARSPATPTPPPSRPTRASSASSRRPAARWSSTSGRRGRAQRGAGPGPASPPRPDRAQPDLGAGFEWLRPSLSGRGAAGRLPQAGPGRRPAPGARARLRRAPGSACSGRATAALGSLLAGLGSRPATLLAARHRGARPLPPARPSPGARACRASTTPSWRCARSATPGSSWRRAAHAL